MIFKKLHKSESIAAIMIVAFWFGVVFYGLIEKRLGFSYTDEICAIALLLMFGYFNIFAKRKICKNTVVVISVLMFYLLYSICIGSNCLAAIFSDMFVVAKPFIACFSIWEMQPRLSQKVLSIFRLSAKIFSIYAIIVASFGINAIILLIGHPAQLASAAISASLIYLLSVNLSKKTLIMHSLMLSVSLLSLRSKAVGECIIDMAFIWVLYNSFVRRDFRVKWYHYAGCSIVLAIVLVAVKTKISVYFISGLSDLSNIREARSALYVTSIRIAHDYFPFGSGYASFASWFSGVYYSKLYAKYGLTGVWGLSKDWYDFVSDTFYPQILSQFGVAGLILSFISIYLLLKKSFSAYYRSGKTLEKAKYLYIVFCITTYIMIESVADSSFVGNRGLFMMMILGIALTELFRVNSISSISKKKVVDEH